MKTNLRAVLTGVFADLVMAMLMLVLGGGTKSSAQVVTNTSDSGPGTLRYAIANATNDATITFCTNLSGAIITLSNTLTINTNLTIDASALINGIQINGNGSVGIFNVASGTTAVLNSLTIINGYIYGGNGAGIYNNGTLTVNNCTLSGNGAEYGGGIYNNGTLTVNNCTLSGNSGFYGGGINSAGGTLKVNQSTLSGNSGGGIYNNGTLTVNNCILSGNSTINNNGLGGGIYNLGGTMIVNQSTLSGNSALFGGGIGSAGGTLTVNQSTLSGNSASGGYGGGGYGGGIWNYYGSVTVNQCTLSSNSVTFGLGGGIYNEEGAATVDQSTLSGNSASGGYGGGINSVGFSSVYSTLTMTNTIVAGNTATSGGDIYNDSESDLTYGGSNLVQSVVNDSGTISGSASITNAPNLAALGNYGGPTQTMPPLPGSPAIAAGCVTSNTFATDQRGYPRLQNGNMDIGAVELPTIEFTANPTNTLVGLSVQFNCPSVDSDGSAITNWNWNFGDGNTSTAQNPSDAYTTVGCFTPGLIVTNNLGLAVPGSGPSITASPPPAIAGISLCGANLMINGGNGISGLTYYVLTSTNFALPFNQWTSVATNIWSANGNFNLTVTNAVNPSIPKQYFLLEVP